LPLSTTAQLTTAITGDPAYKLQENVRKMFRPEWVWDESIKDYSNLGDLKRDPETGLFPEPSSFPEKLAGKAHWDPYLGLFILDLIQIDHKTGEITELQPVMDSSSKEGWPEYDMNTEDNFNEAYQKYYNYIRQKYYDGGRLSATIPDIVIMRDEHFTPEWFGLTLNDLPMVVEKLEAGAEPAYTMSLIMLMTDTDVGILPSRGDSVQLADWVNAFNSMKSSAAEKARMGDLNGLGYLALPGIYEELKTGKGDDLVNRLPEITEGLKGAGKAAASFWGRDQWIKWFENNTETLDTLKWMIDHKINMPWLK
jgi:hypothetical protein